ncbi:acyltransferase [Nanoarchaeota archaeon]
MKHKNEAVDYLRGISILAIITIHVVSLHDKGLTDFFNVLVLFYLKDLLQFAVVTLIICSAFSLYLNHNNLKFNFKDIMRFYKRRISRLLLPFWIFLGLYFSIHLAIKYIFDVALIDLSSGYILKSFLMVGGIGIGWIILTLLLLSLFFPVFLYLYENVNKKYLFLIWTVSFIVSVVFFTRTGVDTYNLSNLNPFTLITMVLSFFTGWGLVYLIGFSFHSIFKKHPNIREELRISFKFIGIFVIFHALYFILGLSRKMYLNKYPPTPYYLSFSIMMTLVLLTLLFGYKRFLKEYTSNFLSFLSSNSYWLFLWNILTLSLITPFLSIFSISNLYLKFVIALVLNIIFSIYLVKLQKKLIKWEISLENHHF